MLYIKFLACIKRVSLRSPFILLAGYFISVELVRAEDHALRPFFRDIEGLHQTIFNGRDVLLEVTFKGLVVIVIEVTKLYKVLAAHVVYIILRGLLSV